MRHLSSLEVNDDISEEKKAEKIEETVDIAPFHKVGDITDPHKLEIIKIHERKGNSFTYEAKKTSDTDLVLSKETCQLLEIHYKDEEEAGKILGKIEAFSKNQSENVKVINTWQNKENNIVFTVQESSEKQEGKESQRSLQDEIVGGKEEAK